jgi:hypothetical protein
MKKNYVKTYLWTFVYTFSYNVFSPARMRGISFNNFRFLLHITPLSRFALKSARSGGQHDYVLSPPLAGVTRLRVIAAPLSG